MDQKAIIKLKKTYKLLSNDDKKKLKKVLAKWGSNLQKYREQDDNTNYNLYLGKIQYNLDKMGSVLEMRGGMNETLNIMERLKNMGYPISELIKLKPFTDVGVDNTGFPKSVTHLKTIGFSDREIDAARKFANGNNARELKEAGFTEKGINAARFSALGHNARKLKKAGFSARELKEAGYKVTELIEANYNIYELASAEISKDDIIMLGYSEEYFDEELKNLSKTFHNNKEIIRILIDSLYESDELEKAGFDEELINEVEADI